MPGLKPRPHCGEGNALARVIGVPQVGTHALFPLQENPFILLGNLSNDVFERHTSTGSEPFSLLKYFEATKFVLLSFFALIEMICKKNLSKITAQECNMSTSGWRASHKNVAALTLYYFAWPTPAFIWGLVFHELFIQKHDTWAWLGFFKGGRGCTLFHTQGTYLIGMSTSTPCFIDLPTSRAQNVSRAQSVR